MGHAESIEGTWDELASHAAEFRGKRLRLTIIDELTPHVAVEGQSLADMLGDFIGCVNGNGENNSDDTGLKFAEYVHSKHRDNRL